jgi:hypothetical protein
MKKFRAPKAEGAADLRCEIGSHEQGRGLPPRPPSRCQPNLPWCRTRVGKGHACPPETAHARAPRVASGERKEKKKSAASLACAAPRFTPRRRGQVGACPASAHAEGCATHSGPTPMRCYPGMSVARRPCTRTAKAPKGRPAPHPLARRRAKGRSVPHAPRPGPTGAPTYARRCRTSTAAPPSARSCGLTPPNPLPRSSPPPPKSRHNHRRPLLDHSLSPLLPWV